MLAQNDEYIADAASTIYQLTEEEKIRLQCEAREDYYRRQRTSERLLQMKENTIEEQKAALSELNAALSEKEAEIARLKALLEQLNP